MLSSFSTKFTKENNDKKIIIKYIVTNLSFEKYNTKYNYFFVSGFLINFVLLIEQLEQSHFLKLIDLLYHHPELFQLYLQYLLK